MPNYTFRSKTTGEEQILSLKISELDQFKENNPDLIQVLNPTPLADPTRLGVIKPDSGFRDVLKKVKSNHYKSTVNTW